MGRMNNTCCNHDHIRLRGSGGGGAGLTGTTRQSGECLDCHAQHWRPNASAEWRPDDTYLADDDEL